VPGVTTWTDLLEQADLVEFVQHAAACGKRGRHECGRLLRGDSAAGIESRGEGAEEVGCGRTQHAVQAGEGLVHPSARTLKTYAGYPHGMPATHADVINADLLTFIQS
jgi:hypothetical protein